MGLRLLSQILVASANHREAAACSEQASNLAVKSDPALAAQILLDSAFVSWRSEGPRHAQRGTAKALGILEEAAIRDTDLAAAAADAHGFLACIQGDPSSMERIEASARNRMGRPWDFSPWSTPWDVGFAYGNLAKVTERFQEARDFLGTLMQAAEGHGATLACQTLAVSLADTEWRMGRLAYARQLLMRAAELAEVGPSIAPFAWIGMAHVTHEMGEDAQRDTWVSRIEDLMERLGEFPYLRLWVCLGRCQAMLAKSHIDAAVHFAELAALTSERSGILEPCVVPWHGAAIEAHVAAGNLGRAEEVVERLEELCVPLQCKAPRAVAATGRALMLWRRGDPGQAEEHFCKALALQGNLPMPLARAETLIAQGRFLRLSGRPKDARNSLHLAIDTLASTGAGRLIAMATGELAVAGGRRSRQSPHARLTAQEKRISALAASGLTNSQIATRLFLSPKTVDHHLSSIYAKLGISSRRELMLPGPTGEGDRPTREPE